MSVCWVDVLYILVIWIVIFVFVILGHPINSCHNTTFFLGLTGSNISLWCYFWKYLCLKFFQEYVIQQLPAQYLTDGSFGKLNVEVGCSISKGLGI
jgi:hypothetical protein